MLTYGFYDSVNGDRRYSAAQMTSLFDGIINDGVFTSIGDQLMVYTTGNMGVVVGAGRAWFNSTWTNNDAPLPLAIQGADGTKIRKDAIVLEVDINGNKRQNSIKVITGTQLTVPPALPNPPALANGPKVFQHPLAYIIVRQNSQAINPADIINMVGTDDCPFVTGILETVSVSALLGQWEGQWVEWLNDIKEEATQMIIENADSAAGEVLAALNQRDGDMASRLTNLESAPQPVQGKISNALLGMPKVYMYYGSTDFLISIQNPVDFPYSGKEIVIDGRSYLLSFNSGDFSISDPFSGADGEYDFYIIDDPAPTIQKRFATMDAYRTISFIKDDPNVPITYTGDSGDYYLRCTSLLRWRINGNIVSFEGGMEIYGEDIVAYVTVPIRYFQQNALEEWVINQSSIQTKHMSYYVPENDHLIIALCKGSHGASSPWFGDIELGKTDINSRFLALEEGQNTEIDPNLGREKYYDPDDFVYGTFTQGTNSVTINPPAFLHYCPFPFAGATIVDAEGQEHVIDTNVDYINGIIYLVDEYTGNSGTISAVFYGKKLEDRLNSLADIEKLKLLSNTNVFGEDMVWTAGEQVFTPESGGPDLQRFATEGRTICVDTNGTIQRYTMSYDAEDGIFRIDRPFEGSSAWHTGYVILGSLSWQVGRIPILSSQVSDLEDEVKTLIPKRTSNDLLPWSRIGCQAGLRAVGFVSNPDYDFGQIYGGVGYKLRINGKEYGFVWDYDAEILNLDRPFEDPTGSYEFEIVGIDPIPHTRKAQDLLSKATSFSRESLIGTGPGEGHFKFQTSFDGTAHWTLTVHGNHHWRIGKHRVWVYDGESKDIGADDSILYLDLPYGIFNNPEEQALFAVDIWRAEPMSTYIPKPNHLMVGVTEGGGSTGFYSPWWGYIPDGGVDMVTRLKGVDARVGTVVESEEDRQSVDVADGTIFWLNDSGEANIYITKIYGGYIGQTITFVCGNSTNASIFIDKDYCSGGNFSLYGEVARTNKRPRQVVQFIKTGEYWQMLNMEDTLAAYV